MVHIHIVLLFLYVSVTVLQFLQYGCRLFF
nr:MAG TPA: hypothetical protein [Caudoviricetes sp.]DAV43384.1 MAG TPA: hypothetical protein [Caudoviricetes sp.]DAZ42238.1 MAG TPA: hypothetical protein [Caudoviricetes sp.]DAZ61376.1 MAG TPA: hypothetical protein [Caudoviricetes sp.]